MSGLNESLQQLQERARREGWASIADEVGDLLGRHPDHAGLLVLRANAANAADDLDSLIDALRRLQRLRSDDRFRIMLADACNRRGARGHAASRYAEALGDFEQAYALVPGHTHAWFNAGLAHTALGHFAEAAPCFVQHLELRPDDHLAAFWLAASHGNDALDAWFDHHAGQSTDPATAAEQLARHGLNGAAAHALTRCNATHALDAADRALVQLHRRGAWAAVDLAAPAVLTACRAADRSTLRAELVAALRLPAVHPHRDSMLAHRQRYGAELATLSRRWNADYVRRAAPRLEDLAHSNFLLAYQGLHDRTLQADYGRVLDTAVQACWPRLAARPERSSSRRIGLLSSCWRSCTVGMYFSGWIDWLVAAGHEVVLYQLGPQRDAWTEHCAGRASRFRLLGGELCAIAETVRDDDLALLVYPELGMDARLLPLAALRLARHQAVAWGHPVSSGLTAMDDFISCGPMEPPDGATHYTEHLVALPGLGVDYRVPQLPDAADPSQLGLVADRPRVLLPQSLFKLHPDGDAVLSAIAKNRPDVQFVLFEPEFPEWRGAFEDRLDAAFARAGLDASKHLHWLPLGSRTRYLQVNRACDVMLDPLYWSGGNTALDAIRTGLPIVACPGSTLRSRQSSAMLDALGLGDALVAADGDAQAELVASLLADRSRRAALSNRMLEGQAHLFDARPARAAFLDWVERAIEA